MRGIHRLSHKRLATAKDGWHHDGAGLYFRRQGDGASWVYRFFSRHDRRMHMLGIGAYPEVSLDAARERHQEYRKRLLRGEDVVAHHAQRRNGGGVDHATSSTVPMAYTFERAARECIAAHEAGWSADQSKQWTESLTIHAFPYIGAVPVDRVDTKHVLKVLRPIWATKHETARRIRGRIENILNWAKVHGYRDGDNPAVWKENLKHVLAKVARAENHHAAVPHKALPKLVATIRAIDSVPARALELLILTAVRTKEVRGATFDEFDLEEKVWTIPGTRMKAGKDHVIPLSPRAVAIVKEQLARAEDKNGLVFPGRGRGGMFGGHAMLKLLHGLNAGGVSHGMRSTFRDWCGENGHPRELAELSLAHNVGNAVERAYYRSKEVRRRREIMDAWAEHCGG
jgi:integrase